MSIAKIQFSDLYLEPDGTSWVKRSPDDRSRMVLDGDALDDAKNLRERVQEHRTGMDFTVAWPNEETGIRLRVQRIETLDGDVFVCRRLMDRVLNFGEIGYHKNLSDAMLSDAMNGGGLVLFTGGTGAGKSTSQGAWLSERMKLFGGTCWTVENPIEMRLGGRYLGTNGSVGTCYQTEVSSEEHIASSIQKFLRAAPNIIMVGEVRTQAAAQQVVFGGMSGILVSTTFHANDIISGLTRFRNLLPVVEHQSLADCIAAIIHQTIKTVVLGGITRKVITISPMVVTGSLNSTSIRAYIRKGDFSMLVSEIERQRALLCTGQRAV